MEGEGSGGSTHDLGPQGCLCAFRVREGAQRHAVQQHHGGGGGGGGSGRLRYNRGARVVLSDEGGGDAGSPPAAAAAATAVVGQQRESRGSGRPGGAEELCEPLTVERAEAAEAVHLDAAADLRAWALRAQAEAGAGRHGEAGEAR